MKGLTQQTRKISDTIYQMGLKADPVAVSLIVETVKLVMEEGQAESIRKAKAEALFKAADAWHEENSGTSPRAYKWLWDRAKKIERGND